MRRTVKRVLTLHKGGGVPSDLAVFADGTPGVLFDFSKTDRLWQNAPGTTPSDGPGENIALALEASKWGGKSYATFHPGQPELVTDANLLVADDGLTRRVYRQAPNPNESVGFGGLNTAINALYRMAYKLTGSAAGSSSFRVDGVGGRVTGLSSFVSSTPLEQAVLNTVIATGLLAISGDGDGTLAVFDTFSVKEIPGSHARQATTAAQPKWQTGGIARFDGSDDSLLTPLNPAAAFTMMFKAAVPAVASTKAIMGSTGTGACLFGLRLEGSDTVLCASVGAQATSTIKAAANIGGTTGVGALTFDGSTVRLFWNAANVYEAAQSGAPDTSVPVRMGAVNGAGDTASLFAAVDLYRALAIKKALSASEIAAITNQWGTT